MRAIRIFSLCVVMVGFPYDSIFGFMWNFFTFISLEVIFALFYHFIANFVLSLCFTNSSKHMLKL